MANKDIVLLFNICVSKHHYTRKKCRTIFKSFFYEYFNNLYVCTYTDIKDLAIYEYTFYEHRILQTDIFFRFGCNTYLFKV